ncbi:hypothetical protein IFM89_010606, partial [Coptis chinensis]
IWSCLYKLVKKQKKNVGLRFITINLVSDQVFNMERSLAMRISGSEIHGFHTIEDLDFEKIMYEATTRWLRPNEILAILCNTNWFQVQAKPVYLPQSGTIVFYNRKMLRNFRKDGHNWMKKKDGKTVKEAHEYLKVGNEERIHVYYAHGQENPTFVRRCYYLLDKYVMPDHYVIFISLSLRKLENIVLVHYRETEEVYTTSLSFNDNLNWYINKSTHTKCLFRANFPDSITFKVDISGSGTSLTEKSTAFGSNTSAIDLEKTLHEINTLEWNDLVVSDNLDEIPASAKGYVPSDKHDQYETNDFARNGTFLGSSNMYGATSCLRNQIKLMAGNGSLDSELPTCSYSEETGDEMNSYAKEKHFEMLTAGMDESSYMVGNDGSQIQDSCGRWAKNMKTESPSSIDDLLAQSPVSTGQGSSTSTNLHHHLPPLQEQLFSVTDISPSWGFSTEETKVIVIGYFHGAHSHLANLYCVFGNTCVTAEKVQVGVFRCIAPPCSPGLVNLYLTIDGRMPISQVLTFEYRCTPTEEVASPEVKSDWREFQVQIRLARLLFSSGDILTILSVKISSNALKEAKKFATITSSIEKDWAYMVKAIQNDRVFFRQAKSSFLELMLRNTLQEWLLERVIGGYTITVCDHEGQGVIHLCAILDYTWAVYLYSCSGLSLDFRDVSGWTALHWASFCGREKMVATLLSSGADPSLVTDPSSEFPGGRTAADLASEKGYVGLAAYLAEKGLTTHFGHMSLSGNISGSLQNSTNNMAYPGMLSEEELCRKDMLKAYQTAADAAARIQTAFRENTLMLQTKAVQSANSESEARTIVSAMKIQHAFRNYGSRKKMGAALQIQHMFRTWKVRKDFINLRQQTIKIQAIFRGQQVRKEYRKIL